METTPSGTDRVPQATCETATPEPIYLAWPMYSVGIRHTRRRRRGRGRSATGLVDRSGPRTLIPTTLPNRLK